MGYHFAGELSLDFHFFTGELSLGYCFFTGELSAAMFHYGVPGAGGK